MQTKVPDTVGWSHLATKELVEWKRPYEKYPVKETLVSVMKTSVLCNPEQHSECKLNGVCMKYWKDGRIFKNAEIAKRLMKKPEDLTEEEMSVGCELEERALKICRLVIFKIEGKEDEREEG